MLKTCKNICQCNKKNKLDEVLNKDVKPISLFILILEYEK